MKIQKLPPEVQSKLESGVVVTDATQCVLALVHNSLDAGANAIAVRVDLKNYQIQVIDNGKGIGKDDLELVGERFMTSKYPSLSSNNTSIVTYGCKGQALSSLLDVCRLLKIESKSENDGPSFVKVFKMNESLPITECCTERPGTGTTVVVEDFMHSMPVRRKRIHEVFDMEEIKTQLQYLAVIHNNVCFTLRNESKGLVLFQTRPSTSLLESITNIFGKTISKYLKPISYQDENYKVSGFVCVKPHRKSNIQLLYVNKRIVTKGVIHKFVNNLLKEYFGYMKHYKNSPSEDFFSKKLQNCIHNVFILEIKCPHSYYELFTNMKKSTVEFKKWKEVLKRIHKAIKIVFKFEKKISHCSTTTTTPHENQNCEGFKETKKNFGTSFLENAVRGAHVKRFLNKKSYLKKGLTKQKKKVKDCADTTNSNLVIENETGKKSVESNVRVNTNDCSNDSLESPIPRRKLKPLFVKENSKFDLDFHKKLCKSFTLSPQNSNFDVNSKKFPDRISNESVIEFYEWLKLKYETDTNAFKLYNDFMKNKKQKECLQNEITEWNSPVFGVKPRKKNKNCSQKANNVFIQKGESSTNQKNKDPTCQHVNDFSVYNNRDFIAQNRMNQKFLNSKQFDTNNLKNSTFLNPFVQNFKCSTFRSRTTRNLKYSVERNLKNSYGQPFKDFPGPTHENSIDKKCIKTPYNLIPRHSEIKYSGNICNRLERSYQQNPEVSSNQFPNNLRLQQNDFFIQNKNYIQYRRDSQIRKHIDFYNNQDSYIQNNDFDIDRYFKYRVHQYRGNQQDHQNSFVQKKIKQSLKIQTNQHPSKVDKKIHFHNSNKKYSNAYLKRHQNIEPTHQKLCKPCILPERHPNRVKMTSSFPSPTSSEIFFANLIKLRNLSESFGELPIYEKRYHNITHTWTSHCQHETQREDYYSMCQSSLKENFKFKNANFKDRGSVDIAFDLNDKKLKLINSNFERLNKTILNGIEVEKYNEFEGKESLGTEGNLSKNRANKINSNSGPNRKFIFHDLKLLENNIQDKKNKKGNNEDRLSRKRLKLEDVSPVRGRRINFHNVEVQANICAIDYPVEKVDAVAQTNDFGLKNTSKTDALSEFPNSDNRSYSRTGQNNHILDNIHNFSQEVPDPDFWNYPTPENIFGVASSLDENHQKSFVLLLSEKTSDRLFPFEQRSPENPSKVEEQINDGNAQEICTSLENLNLQKPNSKKQSCKIFSIEKSARTPDFLNFNVAQCFTLTKNESIYNKNVHDVSNSFDVNPGESSPSTKNGSLRNNLTSNKQNLQGNLSKTTDTYRKSVDFDSNTQKDLTPKKKGSVICNTISNEQTCFILTKEDNCVKYTPYKVVSGSDGSIFNQQNIMENPSTSKNKIFLSVADEVQNSFKLREDGFSSSALISDEQKSPGAYLISDNFEKNSTSLSFIENTQKKAENIVGKKLPDIHPTPSSIENSNFFDNKSQKSSTCTHSTLFAEKNLKSNIPICGEKSPYDNISNEAHSTSANIKKVQASFDIKNTRKSSSNASSGCVAYSKELNHYDGKSLKKNESLGSGIISKESEILTADNSKSSVSNLCKSSRVPRNEKSLEKHPTLTNVERAKSSFKSGIQMNTEEKTSSSTGLFCIGQKSTKKTNSLSEKSISKESQTVAALWTDCLSDLGNPNSNGSNSPSSTELPKTIAVEDLSEQNFNPPSFPVPGDTFRLSERYNFVPKGLSPKSSSASKPAKLTDLDPREKSRIKLTFENWENELLAGVKWEDERTGGSTKPKIPDEILDKMREKAERNLIYYENEILSASMSCCAIKVHNLLHSFAFTKELLSSFEVLGQLDKKFIVARMEILVPKKMDLIAVLDQHAVDERIKLEQIINDYVSSDGKLIATTLNPPIVYTVDESVAQFVSILQEKLLIFGLKLKATDEKTITVQELPKFLLDRNEKNMKNKLRKKNTLEDMIQVLIINIVEEMTETRGAVSKIPKFIHDAFCLEACRGAIKFNKRLKITRMKEMISKLKNCKLPFQCAHGRPSIIPIIDLQDFNSVMPEEEKINYEKLKQIMRERNQSENIMRNSEEIESN